MSALVEGVAALDVARPVAGGEPLLALLRRPVGEALGVDPPLRLLLDPVVADGSGGVLGLGDVVLGELDPVLRGGVGEVGPDPGVAVRLQLQATEYLFASEGLRSCAARTLGSVPSRVCR